MSELLSIDGRLGKGGGQVFRNALALSLGTGRAVHLHHLMEDRRKPCLRDRDLACLDAVRAVSGAVIEGGDPGSSELVVRPGALRPGLGYECDAGRGSCILLLQAVLPPLLYAGRVSVLTVRGATHTPQAPTYEFFVKALLPVLNLTGARLECHLSRYGFHPSGGGEMSVFITPAQEPLRLAPASFSGSDPHYSASISILAWNLPDDLLAREADAIAQALWADNLDWGSEEAKRFFLQEHFYGGVRIRSVPPNKSPQDAGENDFGNVVLWEERVRGHTRVLAAFGGKTEKSADKVALDIKGRRSYYQEYRGLVDRYLADQLVVPLALGGGGSYSCQKPTPHTESALELVRLFSSGKAEARPLGGRSWLVEVDGINRTKSHD